LPDPAVDPLVRFLADESCDFAVVRALRAAGFDVAAVSEDAAGSPDEKVIDLARAEQRILLTEDRDFGRLVSLQGIQRSASCSFGFRGTSARTYQHACSMS
jgi:predicted nuclease of predicted toxin-antitoxin system